MEIKKIFWPHIYVLIFFFIINTISMYVDTDGWEGFTIIDEFLVFDALYYTIVTHTTVGYGDILPKWRYWKMVGALHSLIVFTLLINEISTLGIGKILRRRTISDERHVVKIDMKEIEKEPSSKEENELSEIPVLLRQENKVFHKTI